MLIFSVLFFIFFLPLMIPVMFPSMHRLVGILNRWWARCIFIGCFVPYRIEYREKLDKKRQYIFCPNHFSYLDIPTMGLNYINTIFVGKSALEKIPLFGFMYKKLHITVDRKKLRSRVDSLRRSLQAIDEGKSLVIYPEGGIVSTAPPAMGRFKDGAFRIAIEKQIPIVPVTIPFNWIILPPKNFIVHWKPVKAVFHNRIETTGMTLEDVPALKERVYRLIDDELKKSQTHENR